MNKMLLNLKCQDCENRYHILLGSPATVGCQKCGSYNIKILEDANFEVECVKCKEVYILQGNETVQGAHLCGSKLLTIRSFTGKVRSEEIKNDLILKLTYKEIKNAKEEFKNISNIKIGIATSGEQQHIDFPYFKELESKLSEDYSVYTFPDKTFDRQDYACLNEMDLLVGQYSMVTSIAIRLRVPTLIIHTPVDIKMRGEVAFYGAVTLNSTIVDEIIKKVCLLLTEPNLSYCLVTHNRLDSTIKCIAKIRESKRFNEEIVIVDNGSTDDTVEWLKKQEGLSIYYNKSNEGCIKGRNLAMQKAKGRYLLILDNDQYLNLDSIHKLRLVDADIVGVEGWQLTSTGSPISVKEGNVDYVGAGGMFVRRVVAEELGYFSEEYSPAWYEDPDFCFKAREKNYSIAVCDANIEHIGHGTSKTQTMFDFQQVMNRNRKVFRTKWGGRFGIKLSQSKPKILMLVDVVGWAWDYKTRQIQRYLSDEFDIEIIYQNQIPSPMKDLGYDLYFCFDCPFIGYFKNIDKRRKITGVTAHTYTNFHNFVLLLQEAIAIHANSVLLYDEVKRYNDNVYYVPNGVDENHFRYFERDINDTFRVGYVGKDTVRKGFTKYIKPACKQANVELKSLVAKYKSVNKINYMQMPEFYHDVDCVIVASDMDGTPNQLLEAGSVGRTFIGNKIGNVPQFYVKDFNGYMIDNRDEGTYIKFINMLKNDRKLCREMGEHARRTVELYWTWKIKSENYRTMFWEVLNGKKEGKEESK